MTVETGRAEIVRMLLAQDRIKPHPCSRRERDDGTREHSPLIYAFEEQRVEILRMLLYKGVRPGQIADEANVPALSIAAKGGNPLIVRMLLDHGAEVNTIGPRDHTPFFEAVIAESILLMEILLDAQSLSTNKNIVTLLHSCSGGQGARRER